MDPVGRVVFSVALGLLLACGCAAPRQPPASSAPEARPVADATPSESVPLQSVVTRSEGLAALREGPVTIEVRMAQPADAKSLGYLTETEAMTAVMAWPLLIGATAGLAAAPILLAYAAYFVVGIPGTYVTGEGIESSRRSVMERALKDTDFPRLMRESLERRVKFTLANASEPTDRRLEIVVLGYGFTKRGESDACSFATAAIRGRVADRVVLEDSVVIGGAGAAPDTPPAYCTGIKRLLEDDARLARRTLAETAEIVGAIVARRLEAGS